MIDRDPLHQSFDPRTWMGGTPDEAAIDARSADRSRAPSKPVARPPFFLAAATAAGILSMGAAAAFFSRGDAASTTQVAAALETAGSESGDAGASIAGDQP